MREFLNEIKKYLTPVNTAIMVITIVCFIVQIIADNAVGEEAGTYSFSLAWWLIFEEHQYYRLFTYMFLHASLGHIFNNMLVLGFVGSTAERMLGGFKYAAAYIGSGLVAGLASAVYNRWCFANASEAGGFYTYSLGASGAVFGITGVLLWIVLVNRGRVAGISLRQIVLFMFLSIYAGVTSTGIDNTAHIAGAAFGILSAMILYDRRGGFA